MTTDLGPVRATLRKKMLRDALCFIISGTLFQDLVASLMNVNLARFYVPYSISLPKVIDLVDLEFSTAT